MKAVPICISAALVVLAAPVRIAQAAGEDAPAFIRGADVSSLPYVEAGGGRFRDGGVEAGALEILTDHGFTCVRLRLWHSPEGGTSGLDETLGLAERAKAAGFTLLLDIHYSDTWADPGRQTKPAAWGNLPFETLVDSVRMYTIGVLTAFRARGTPPDIIQVGNEISCGMLWDDGRVCGAFDTPTQRDRLSSLVSAGVRGARASVPQFLGRADRGSP